MPIPKPVPGETRLLTLLHDLNSMLYGEIGMWLNDALAKAGSADPALVMHKPGKGCNNVTHLVLAAKEDAIASRQSLAEIANDEEKMFCCMTVLIQCMAL